MAHKNGTGYFPQYVDAIIGISVWSNFSWEKLYQDQQFWFSSLFSRAHFVFYGPPCTVEPPYNEVLRTMKFTLCQVSHIRVKKTKKYKELGPAKLPCYKRVLLYLYNEVPLYNVYGVYSIALFPLFTPFTLICYITRTCFIIANLQ